MRILQVITLCELGGAQVVMANIANNLSEEHEIIVAAGEGDGKMWMMLNPNIKQEPCKHLRRALSPLDDLRTIFDFWRLYWKYKPDIIHLHSSKAGMLGRIAFPARKIVYTVHGFDSIRLAHRTFLWPERIMQWRCKFIAAVSKYDKKNLLNENIKHKVTTVYNGNPIPKIEPNLSFNIPSKYEKTILCIARMEKPKNSNIFLELASLFPQYAFVWIGNQNEVKEHPENVFFMGNIPNAAMYNSIADLFILPSNYEGLPIVIIEAMSLGKPIVASDVGGVSELVRNGINGFVVENQVVEFAEKINYILNNEEVMKRFSENSKRIYAEEFTVDRMVNIYKEMYNKILFSKRFRDS